VFSYGISVVSLHLQRGLGLVPMGSFDWLSQGKALSITTSHTSQILSKNSTHIFSRSFNTACNWKQIEDSDCQSDSLCLQTPAGQTYDRKSIIVWEGSFHSTLERLLCRLFHNPNRISPKSRICYIWYKMLAACTQGWQRIFMWMLGKYQSATWLWIHLYIK